MLVRLAGAAILIAVATGARAQSDDPYAQARLACIGDVMRLCPEAMMDPEQARACMKDKKKLVSPECAAFYPGGKRAGEVQ